MRIIKRPIGIFDSGVGGLTVVSEVRRHFPNLDIIYFGDTARVPYGNKSPQTVIRYSLEVGRFLAGLGVVGLVVACNTSSSLALESLNNELAIPVLGMIQPGAKAGSGATRNRKIGLIGTRATVASGAYPVALKDLNPSLSVFSAACPLFVPLVEEGWADDSIAREVALRYLGPLVEKGIDTLILGCTHYPVLMPVMKEVLGSGVRLISSASSAAEALGESLIGAKIQEKGASAKGRLTCYVTDAGTHFREVGERILGEPIEEMVAVAEERLVLP